jgi:hypothetical protein
VRAPADAALTRARIAATLRSYWSVPSICAAISSSGCPNGRSSTRSTSANGLSSSPRKASMPPSSTLRGMAVK